MFLKSSFKDAKINAKFNIVLILVFIIGILLSGITLQQALQQRAETEIASKATMLMQTMNAVRNYTQDRVNPLLKERIYTEEIFPPAAIPTFSVREVFEYFRSDPGYGSFFYKDAAPNPINLRDKADEFETQLVEEFREQRFLEKKGWRNLPSGKVFFIAQPFVLREQRCLECHTTPDRAPRSLVNSYGAQNGFGWQLNDVVAAQVVYVPAEEVFTSARRTSVKVLIIVVSTLITTIVLTNLLLKRVVIRRIQKIAKTAQAVSTGEMVVDLEEDAKDEIGLLSISFNRMKSSLEVAMRLLNQRKGG